ncbi:MAG: outer membrane lipid asymmetry maintenance protein MlaD [Alphaproteobacteria bacterium]|nr:outer membrane lipid asymmetry maintenance protein MlaD [Alphaproteobacteria bacterium]
MNQNNTAETLIGAVVIAVAIAFIVFAYRSTGGGGLGGYEITADLARVDGLSVGTDVRLSGIKIGTVSDLSLKPNYLVTVHMHIREDVKIPTDSSLVVTSSGFLGSSYLSISPGGDDSYLKDGDKIGHTQGSVDLMGLVGRFINNGAQGGQSQGQPPKPSPSPGAAPTQPATSGPAPLPKGAGP